VPVLQLRFLILDGQADWPVVQVLVDGREAFVDGLPGWQGFDPADLLGDQSPLLPEDGQRGIPRPAGATTGQQFPAGEPGAVCSRSAR
jgi:hypothetical protein